MTASRRTRLTLLLGLVVGVPLTLGGVALARASARFAPSGPAPGAPTFPARVVRAPCLAEERTCSSTLSASPTTR